jgi:hypothetical protein
MKLSYSLTVAAAIISSATAFAPTIRNRAVLHTGNSRFLATSAEVATEEAAEPVKVADIDTDIPVEEEEEVIAKIGVTKDDLAIGINLKDFLKYCGT